MAISLNALQYVTEVAKTKSISKASEHFYLSQPHLSNTIRVVEKELGTILFKRSARGMELTEAGKIFVARAQKIIAEMEDLEDSFRELPAQRVRVNISITRSYQVTRIFSEFINQNYKKDVFELHIRETNPFQVLEDVRCGVANFGVLHFYETQQEYFSHYFKAYNLECISQYKRPFLLAMSVDNPLSRRDEINLTDLQKQVIVLYGDYESQNVPCRLSDSPEFVSEKHIYVYDRSTAMELLGSCPGTYTVITGLHPATVARYNLVLRKCSDLNLYNIGCLIYRKGEKQSTMVRELRDRILEIDWSERVI